MKKIITKLASCFDMKGMVIEEPVKKPKNSKKEFKRITNLEANNYKVGRNFQALGKTELLFGEKSEKNSVIIGDEVVLNNLKINIKGKNCKIIINNGVRFTGHILVSGSNRVVRIGENTTAVGVYILAREKDVTIGRDCMFSREIEIRSTDVHKIYHIDDTERLNKPEEVSIGDRVWVGAKVFISKGVVIPNGCIVGACSFVNKKFEEENSIIAGTPAKVVKNNIRWER